MAQSKSSQTEVVMRGQVSGTRDGTEWPPPGGKVKLPADEADALISSKMAVAASDKDAVASVEEQLEGKAVTTAPESR